jgi:hypothetical protein
MANVVDYLTRIQDLTNTNLQILKTLNDSFYTKQNHLFADINGVSYVIPSFLSLENKVNALQENFENLVKSPETGEAHFNFDGNTRSIEVRKYSHVPDKVQLNTVETFNVESNDVFKDFMTPVPYVNFDLPTLPNDITQVNIKKIIPHSTELKSMFNNKLKYTVPVLDENGEQVIENEQPKFETRYHTSFNVPYGDVHKMLLNYTEDVDYVEYNTTYNLPVRKNIGTATYVIEDVISDEINLDLEEYFTLKLRSDLTNPIYSNTLTYKTFEESIEKPLKVGDELINYDGTGKVVITEVRTSTNTIVVRVVNGEYLNFMGTNSYEDGSGDILDSSKIRFHSAYDFDNDKYVKVPLEEDQYVYIAIAPINTRLNVQSSWGNGVIINTYKLNMGTTPFKSYYEQNVRNIGDTLFEMTSMVTSPLTSLTETEFTNITSYKPNFGSSDVAVYHINKHLNNSDTVKNIRTAYNQKKTSEIELNEVQAKIDDLNSKLSNISFDDTAGLRTIYTNQLSQFVTRRNELNNIISKAVESISINVNSAEVPLENAKYRIRGFFVPTNIGVVNGKNVTDHVIGIQVQYRYKNSSYNSGTALSIVSNDNTYIYSDWNMMSSFNKSKYAKFEDGMYKYEYEASNENINEPSYNQIDIPITQGESVDVRLRLIYDFGQPYITVKSDWSDVVTVKFPDEFAKDVPILTIIEENNSDIETNRFNNILETTGVTNHTSDNVVDQDLTYFHKPESIASGFYTNERRVIPLGDKLKSMSDDIASILSEINTTSSQLEFSISLSDSDTPIFPNQTNNIILESYNDILNKKPSNVDNYTVGDYDIDDDDNITTIVNLSLVNPSDASVKLYSIFPGSRDVTINGLTTDKDKSGYTTTTGGVHYDWLDKTAGDNTLQRCNQFITFRTKDVWTGNNLYGDEGQMSATELPSYDDTGFVVYPYLADKYGMCMDSNDIRTYKVINPGEEIIIPLMCKYKLSENEELQRTILFDIRTSLYNEPISYSITFTVKNTNTVADRVYITHKKSLFNRLLRPLKYRIIRR